MRHAFQIKIHAQHIIFDLVCYFYAGTKGAKPQQQKLFCPSKLLCAEHIVTHAHLLYAYSVFHYTNTCTRHLFLFWALTSTITLATTTLYISNKSINQDHFFPTGFFPLDYTFGVCTIFPIFVHTHQKIGRPISSTSSKPTMSTSAANNSAFNIRPRPLRGRSDFGGGKMFRLGAAAAERSKSWRFQVKRPARDWRSS